jgi:hypothetical protein
MVRIKSQPSCSGACSSPAKAEALCQQTETPSRHRFEKPIHNVKEVQAKSLRYRCCWQRI